MSRELKQALSVFAIATVLVATLGLIALGVGFVNANLGAFCAIVWLYLSVWVANRRGEDLIDFGFSSKPRVRSIVIALGYMAIIFPIFVVGFVIFHDMASDKESLFAPLAQPGICFGFDGWASAHWPKFGFMSSKLVKLSLEFVFIQVVVVALPEELFFRGLIHEFVNGPCRPNGGCLVAESVGPSCSRRQSLQSLT